MMTDNDNIVFPYQETTEQEGDVMEWVNEGHLHAALSDLALFGNCFSKVLAGKRYHVPFKNVVRTDMDTVSVYVLRDGGLSDEGR